MWDEKFAYSFQCNYAIYVSDRRTDRQTPHNGIATLRIALRAKNSINILTK